MNPDLESVTLTISLRRPAAQAFLRLLQLVGHSAAYALAEKDDDAEALIVAAKDVRRQLEHQGITAPARD